MTLGTATLSTNITAFCAVLRDVYGFTIGPGETHDALRALERIGVADELRVRCALRLVCCGTQAQTIAFERAFEAFFRPSSPGIEQPAYAPRHTRAGPEPPATQAPNRAAGRPSPVDDGAEGAGGKAAERRLGEPGSDDATTWQAMRARYSPVAAADVPPRLSSEHFDRMLAAAGRVIASVRLGRSRRWAAVEHGRRFDLRRTIRASLQSGGDPVDVRYLGPALRYPRFVVLIDASRSMTEQTGAIVHFARALCERSSRVRVFFFSTALRDVTRELRAAELAGGQLGKLGDAWGGGTKIGASLEAFVANYGASVLSPDTLVFICSDGLDAGDVPQLECAMRTIDRRCAGVVWLNPHASAPGYAPTARAMRAALPYIMLLTSANDATDFTTLAQRLRKEPRIRNWRR